MRLMPAERLLKELELQSRKKLTLRRSRFMLALVSAIENWMAARLASSAAGTPP
jgi:hypothetical protein